MFPNYLTFQGLAFCLLTISIRSYSKVIDRLYNRVKVSLFLIEPIYSGCNFKTIIVKDLKTF